MIKFNNKIRRKFIIVINYYIYFIWLFVMFILYYYTIPMEYWNYSLKIKKNKTFLQSML